MIIRLCSYYKALSWDQRLALVWLVLLVLLATLAPVLPLPYPAALPDLYQMAVPPFMAGSRHWLGTDPQGRDVLAELVFGTRTVLWLSLPAAAIATVLGALLGGAAGFWGNTGIRLPSSWLLLAFGVCWWLLALPFAVIGFSASGLGLVGIAGAWYPTVRQRIPRVPLPLDALVLGTTALLGAVPRFVLVMALGAGLSLSPAMLLVILAITTWPEPARLVRAEMLSIRNLPFVTAARALGLPTHRVWWRHALPQAYQPLRASFPLSVAGLIGLESTLSFLGIGLPPEVPSWGHVLATARAEPTAWWLIVGPGGLLFFTILALYHLAGTGKHTRTQN